MCVWHPQGLDVKIQEHPGGQGGICAYKYCHLVIYHFLSEHSLSLYNGGGANLPAPITFKLANILICLGLS